MIRIHQLLGRRQRCAVQPESYHVHHTH